MNQQDQIIYFLGQIKATIEYLCSVAMEEEYIRLLDFLVDFESEFNQEMKRIFG